MDTQRAAWPLVVDPRRTCYGWPDRPRQILDYAGEIRCHRRLEQFLPRRIDMLKRLWWKLVRFGFRLLYNEMAWTYDLVSWLASLGEWRKWQLAGLPYVSGKHVLEIAHGPGHMLLALARTGYQVTGLDLSPQMGHLAQARLRKNGLDAPLVRGRAQTLPFPDGAFDTVFCTFPTEFIAHEEVMTSVHRILSRNGRFIVVPEGHLTGGGVLVTFVNWLYEITGQRREAFAVGHDRYWPDLSQRWNAFLHGMRSAGFEVELKHLRLSRSGVTVLIANRADLLGTAEG